jgi:hypothetical protein
MECECAAVENEFVANVHIMDGVELVVGRRGLWDAVAAYQRACAWGQRAV